MSGSPRRWSGLSGGRLDLGDRHPASDLEGQPVAQRVRRAVATALAAQQTLDLLLDAVCLDAGRAMVHVVLQAGSGGRVALTVEHEPDVGKHCRAVELHIRVSLRAHCLTSWRSASLRLNPRSPATSPSKPLSCL